MVLYGSVIVFTHRKPKARRKTHFLSIWERINLMSVFISYGCHRNLPQSGWLKQEIYFLTFWSTGSVKSGCQRESHILSEGSRGECFLVSPPSGGSWGFLTCGGKILIPTSIFTRSSSLCLCVSPPFLVL